MYKLKVKDNYFTIPKQNLKLLAMTKALDLKIHANLDTEKEIIDFFKSIGIIVEEI